MTLQQAIEHVKQGEAQRRATARRLREDAERERALTIKKIDKERADFIAKWFPLMREYLNSQIENAALIGTPSANCSLLSVSAVEPNGEHEIALLEVLKAHYETAGFTVHWWLPNQVRSIQVSGWMESHCG